MSVIKRFKNIGSIFMKLFSLLLMHKTNKLEFLNLGSQTYRVARERCSTSEAWMFPGLEVVGDEEKQVLLDCRETLFNLTSR